MFLTNSLDTRILSEQSPNYLLDIMSNVQGKKEIQLLGGTDIAYLVIVYGNSDITLDITTQDTYSKSHVNILCLGQANHTTTCTVNSRLVHSHTATNIHMVTFLPTGSDCRINGNVTIVPNIMQASGHLLEENIILGEHIRINTLPMLDVQSNDVSASHGARIEKIDAKKLFYAQSRGLRVDQATGLIIGGYIDVLFDTILHRINDMADKAHIEAVKHNYMKMLLGEVHTF